MKSFGTALLVLLVAVAVSACGDAGSPAGAPQPTDQAVITGTPAGSNADDVAFASATASSYGQASELTTLVPEQSTDPKVVALAADIVATQRPNLQTMKVFLVQWGSNSDGGPGARCSGGRRAGDGRRRDDGAAEIAARQGLRHGVATGHDRASAGGGRAGAGRTGQGCQRRRRRDGEASGRHVRGADRQDATSCSPPASDLGATGRRDC